MCSGFILSEQEQLTSRELTLLEKVTKNSTFCASVISSSGCLLWTLQRPESEKSWGSLFQENYF
jgi:hypothetical protein